MCGRFTLKTPTKEIVQQLDLPSLPEIRARYNIAPTQQVLVVRAKEGGGSREAVLMKWGLIPSWAKDVKIGNKAINARGDTAAEKPMFRSAMKRRRCLIPADGFFEWKQTSAKKKQPYYIGLKQQKLFCFAGLWEHWHNEEQAIDSCTILTTEANDFLRPLHDRMPVILPAEAYDEWLDPATQDASQVGHMLAPFPSNQMQAFAVSTEVNKPTHDEPELIERVPVQETLPGME